MPQSKSGLRVVQPSLFDDQLPKLKLPEAAIQRLIQGDDNLLAEKVKPHTRVKHDSLFEFVRLCGGPRNKYLGPGKPGAAFIDLFCGTGRVLVDGHGWRDGSAVVAWKASLESGSPFSQILIADANEECRAACAERLNKLGVLELQRSAVDAVQEAVERIKPSGLHLALLDPFNLASLDFDIIKTLTRLARPDLLLHLSHMDLHRNVAARLDSDVWDRAAPGWREAVDPQKSSDLCGQFVEYWRELIVTEGRYPVHDFKLIRGDKNQPLYWLVLAAKHELALKLWEVAANPTRQKSFSFDGPLSA
jgi:three-Cys-motif partner protein